jgi:hypothetical protein
VLTSRNAPMMSCCENWKRCRRAVPLSLLPNRSSFKVESGYQAQAHAASCSWTNAPTPILVQKLCSVAMCPQSVTRYWTLIYKNIYIYVMFYHVYLQTVHFISCCFLKVVISIIQKNQISSLNNVVNFTFRHEYGTFFSQKFIMNSFQVIHRSKSGIMFLNVCVPDCIKNSLSITCWAMDAV